MHTQGTLQTVTSAAATGVVASDSVSTRNSRLRRVNKLNQHCITYTTSRTTYAQVVRDWVATSALAMRPPEDLSKITPLEPTWRAHSAVQIEMSSLRNELLQMQHNRHDHQASQESLQNTMHNMQQDTEEIKGNLLLMMDMLQQLHPNFSVLQPTYTLHPPPNGS